MMAVRGLRYVFGCGSGRVELSFLSAVCRCVFPQVGFVSPNLTVGTYARAANVNAYACTRLSRFRMYFCLVLRVLLSLVILVSLLDLSFISRLLCVL